MRLIDADVLMEKLNGIWDCNDMTFAPVDRCCIDADCKSCRWRETIEYVKRLVQKQTTISELIDRQTAMLEIAKLAKIVPYYFHGEIPSAAYFNEGLRAAMWIIHSQPPASPWHRVEDGLPKESGEYIVAYHPCYWDDVDTEVTKVGIDNFRGKSAWAKKKFQRVTHWMDKPEPPVNKMFTK